MKRKTKKQIRKEKRAAGSLGGLATVANHPELDERGKNAYMSKTGKAGAESTWTRYRITAYGQTQYALISRATGKIVKIIGRSPKMERILGE